MTALPQATPPGEVRRRAEALWREREQQRSRSDADTTPLIQELQIHQIELEMQNQSLLETQAELTATQTQLSETLESYRELYDLAPAGYFTVASDGTIREVNRGGEALLGRPRDDLLGRRLGVFVAVADLPSFKALISRVLGSGDAGGCEISIDDAAAPPKRVRIDASRSSDSSTCLLVVVDVTAAWSAERALRSSERQIRELMEALPQQVWTATAAGALTHVSEGAASYFGMPAGELVASWWSMLIHADDRPRWKKHWAAALAAARACEIDVRLRRADGAYRWHAVMARPMREGSGAVTMWIGTNTDVTFLRQLEDRRLETSAAQERTRAAIRFREGIECVSDGLALWDPEERLVACNSAFAALLPDSARALLTSGGTQREIALAMLAADEPGMPAAERAAVIDERMAQSADPGRTVELTLRDGRVVEFSRRRTSDGGSLSIHHDVTARKRHADDLEKALGVERAANAMQQRFVSIVSHEFRTPLTVIDGAAQRVLRRLPEADAETRDKLQRIRANVVHMVALIDRTLSHDRMMSGRLEFRPVSLDLCAVLRNVHQEYCEIAPAFRFSLSLPQEPVRLNGDPQELAQIFTNLLSNAVKFSSRSKVIEIALVVEGEWASAVVRDQGIGIDPADMAQLFSRYFRAQTANGIQGSGLGLHLVKELVEMHGGTIGVTSQCGSGSAFTVRLPLAAED